MNEQERETLAQFPKKRSSLIPILQKLQETEKYISPEIITEVGQYLDLSENDIYSVAGFYPDFRLTAQGEHNISVCLCLACRLRGGNDILLALEKELGISVGQITGDLKFSLNRITLSGCSGPSPVVMVDKTIVDNIAPDRVKEIVTKLK